jgi:amino acid transporter
MDTGSILNLGTINTVLVAAMTVLSGICFIRRRERGFLLLFIALAFQVLGGGLILLTFSFPKVFGPEASALVFKIGPFVSLVAPVISLAGWILLARKPKQPNKALEPTP